MSVFKRVWGSLCAEIPATPIRVVAYNILAQCFLGKKTAALPHGAFAYRRDLLTKELETYAADILCLQEVEHYEDQYKDTLAQLGYDGQAYGKRTSHRKINTDGCGVFWRTSRFKCLERTPIRQNNLKEMHPCLDYIDDTRLKRDSAACIVALEDLSSPGNGLIIASVHLHWDGRLSDIQTLQTAHIRSHMQRLRRKYRGFACVMGGDFNKPKQDPLTKYILKDSVPAFPETLVSEEAARLIAKIASDDPHFASAYPLDKTTASTFYSNHISMIDYIFYEPARLKATWILTLPEASDQQTSNPYPNASHPSDHLPIGAEFVYLP